MLQIIMILLPKRVGDYHGIGLQNHVWKITKIVTDNRLKCLELHACFHIFTACTGCGTAIMEIKLVQQLMFVEQTSLYDIFIDLRKAFGTMDCGVCLARDLQHHGRRGGSFVAPHRAWREICAFRN